VSVRVGWDEGDQVYIDLVGDWDLMSNDQPRSVWVVGSDTAREIRDELCRLLGGPEPASAQSAEAQLLQSMMALADVASENATLRAQNEALLAELAQFKKALEHKEWLDMHRSGPYDERRSGPGL